MRRRWAMFWVVGYQSFGFGLLYIGIPQNSGTLILAGWPAMVLVSLWWLRLSECPQCGQLFYANSKWGQTNLCLPFSGKCMHCGFDLDHPDSASLL
jgi:hypothetical protein